MHGLTGELLRAFILLFAVIDPIGTIPIFLQVTAQYDAAVRRKIAVRSVLVAAVILLFFIVAGQLLIEKMEISLPAFQVSGGLVLLLFALSMVFGKGSHGEESGEVAHYSQVVVFPMAMPAIASPGAILAVVLLTDNHVYTIGQQALRTLIVLFILGIVLVLLLMANRIQRAIGKTGIMVVTKIMGLLLCGIAVESMLGGIKAYYGMG